MKKKLNPCSLTIFICLINLVLSSCSNQNRRDTIVNKYPHVINIEEGFNNMCQIKLSEIADSIRYIILSNDNQGPIGDVGGIQLTNSNIYLRKRDGFVLRFNRSGKFLNSFGNIGRGPMEYLPGSVFTITPEDDKIHIFRSAMDNYLTFKPDGSYTGTREFSIPRTMFNFTSLSDSSFMCTFYYVGAFMKDYILHAINWSAGIFDPVGNPLQVIEHPLKNAEVSISEIPNVSSNAPSITYFDNRAVIIPKGDTIYEVSSDSIYTGYIINWGKIPHKEGNELHFRVATSATKLSIGNIVLETATRTYIRVYQGNDSYIFEYDKTTGATKAMLEDPQNLGFVNDIDGGINFYPYYTNREGDIWIINEDAYSFKQKQSPDYLSQSISISRDNKEKLKTFIQKIKEDDNPVLRIVYLKNNYLK
jgi:hypothetical protein